MINWNILGIAPTSDKSAIKKAYRSRLAETNPEDKPEEFMELRQAYEEALEYAKEAASAGDKPETSDVGQELPSCMTQDLLPKEHPAYRWTKELQRLYADFYRRIDSANWEALAANPLCTRIDTAADVQDALLRFLMEWWFLPDSVIQTLDRTFHFEENRDTLIKRYPKEFVDAILLMPLNRKGGGLDYTFFEGPRDADYDWYINLYYTLNGHVNRHEQEEGWQCVSDMESTGIFHPYLHVEKAKLYLNEENLPLAAAEMEAVYPSYDSNVTICCMAGEIALAEENFEQAEERFRKSLELRSSSHWACMGMAEACLGLKKYEEAQKWVDQVLAEDRYSPRGQELEEAIQEGRREELRLAAETDQASVKEKLDLAVIYIDKGEFENASILLTGFTAPEKKEEAERLHYLATAWLSLGEAEHAIGAFLHAEEILEELRLITSDPEEKEKHTDNLARTRVMRSVCLEELDQMEDALAAVTNVTIDCPQLPVPFARKAELHYEMKQFEEAIEAATEAIRLDDTFHLPYRIRANAYYELGHYNDAYEDCNDCINCFAGDIEAYFCKINILIEVGEFDEAFQELDSLEAQVQGTQITFLRGKAQEASNKLEEARFTYRSVLEDAADENREVFSPAEIKSTAGVMFRLVQVCEELFVRTGKQVFRQEYMELLQDGVRRFPSDLDLMGDLAGEYYGMSRHKEAQKLYERMAELDPAGFRYAQIAGNEIQMDCFDAALHHLQMAVEMEPDLVYAQILFCAIHIHRGEYEEALKRLDRAELLSEGQDRKWPRILRDKGMIYARMKEYDKAIECYRENWNRYHETDVMCSIIEMYRLSGRFDQALEEGKNFLAAHSLEQSLDVLDEIKQTASILENWDLVDYCCSRDPRPFFRHFYAGRHLMYSDVCGKDTPHQALDHFLKAYEADPTALHNLLEVARLYYKLKDKKKACEFAEKVLAAVPADFMDSGYQRAYYLARSAEALGMLGRFEEAEERIQMALEGRKCEFCRFAGCIDAYCALVYLACIRGDEEAAAKYQREGLAVCPHDIDLQKMPEYFMKKKGFFK